jgi:hypothetical protein
VAGSRRILVASAVAALATASVAAAADTWPKMQPNAADQALAKKSVLHITDFTPGSGWKAVSSSSRSNGDAPAACKGPAFDQTGQITTGTADTSFEATGIRVWSEADVMKTLAMARRDVKAVSGGPILSCLRSAFEKELPSEARFVSAKALPFPAVGDWSTAYRALIDVSVNGTKVRLQLDMVLVLDNRVEITLMQMAPFALSAGPKAAEERMVQHLTLNALTA